MDTPILKQTWKSTTEKTQTVEPITQKHDLFKGVKKWLREIKKQKRVNRVHTHLTVIRWSKRLRRLDKEREQEEIDKQNNREKCPSK